MMSIEEALAAAAETQGKVAKADAGPTRKASDEARPKAEIALPKTAAGVADLLYETQKARYALQAQAKNLEAVEAACREFLIDELPKSEASGVSGKVARVFIENKAVTTVADWSALYDYIRKAAPKNAGIWGLLQKRISSAMADELLADPVEAKKLRSTFKVQQIPIVHLSKL